MYIPHSSVILLASIFVVVREYIEDGWEIYTDSLLNGMS